MKSNGKKICTIGEIDPNVSYFQHSSTQNVFFQSLDGTKFKKNLYETMGKRKASEVIDLEEDNEELYQDNSPEEDVIDEEDEEIQEPKKKKAKTTSPTKKVDSASKASKKKTKEPKPVNVSLVATKTMKELGKTILSKIEYKKRSGRFSIERVDREVFEAMFPTYQFKPTNVVATISCKSYEDVCSTIGGEYAGRSFRYRGHGDLKKLSIRYNANERKINISFNYDVEK